MDVASWRVNSYGYPNPFTTERGRKAWGIFESFLVHRSYEELKRYWSKRNPAITPHGVESWKANFEECGLLYVLRGDDHVNITPAGTQLKQAAVESETEFAWIGTNLVLRYSLKGKAGRPRRAAPHVTSDIMPYWLVLAATLELGGLWQTELFRVLGGVFQRSDIPRAIERIRAGRAGELNLLNLPNLATRGAGYNSLNQVAVKAGLYNMTLEKSNLESPYFEGREAFWSVADRYRSVLELALGGNVATRSQCSNGHESWTQRIPAAPTYSDEIANFEAIGSKVASFNEATAMSYSSPHAPTVDLGADIVHLITEGVHCKWIDDTTVEGPVSSLCRLSPDRRVLINTDLNYTYLVVDKSLLTGSVVRVNLRRARRIQDREFVKSLFAGQDHAPNAH